MISIYQAFADYNDNTHDKQHDKQHDSSTNNYTHNIHGYSLVPVLDDGFWLSRLLNILEVPVDKILPD